MPRTDFSDEQRAEIFVLDRATCSFSGRSLWIADYGIDPGYAIDWADHVVPASRGGKSVVDNGAAASWLYNYLRGNGQQRLVLYRRGVPTATHTIHVGTIDPVVASQLRRFRALHTSDWYLNRAMWHVWIGVTFEHQRRQGLSRSRDYGYYAGAALKALVKWRRYVDKDSVTSIESRHLVQPDADADQAQILEVRTATSKAALIQIMKSLYPVYEATAKAMFALSEAESPLTIEAITTRVRSHKRIPRRFRERFAEYGGTLGRLIK